MPVKKTGKSGFEGIEEATLKRNYLPEGEYLVRAKQLTHDEDPQNREFVGADFEVIASTNDAVKPKAVYSTYFTPNKFRSYFLRDTKALLAALGGPDVVVDAEFADKAFSEEQTLRGKICQVVVRPTDKLNEKTGQPYLNTVFASLKDAGIEESDLPVND